MEKIHLKMKKGYKNPIAVLNEMIGLLKKWQYSNLNLKDLLPYK